MERRQTTILVADVIGWTRMTARDEEAVIARLQDAMAATIAPAIAASEDLPAPLSPATAIAAAITALEISSKTKLSSSAI